MNFTWLPEHPAGHHPYCASPSHPLIEACRASESEPQTLEGRPSRAWRRDHPSACPECYQAHEIACVALALQANACPLDGKRHRAGTRAIARCAALAQELGYVGYDFGRERWVREVVPCLLCGEPTEGLLCPSCEGGDPEPLEKHVTRLLTDAEES